MKLSLNWIREFVDLNGISPEEIKEKTNISICEIDSFSPFMPYLNQVFPSLILDIQPHPKSKNLWITKVYCNGQNFQVITNDPNLKKQDLVACALPGCKINDKTIQPTSINGVDSHGMFCSGKDLGLNENTSGVFILNAKDLPKNSIHENKGNLYSIYEKELDTNRPISQELGYDDIIIEIDNKSITHRPDLWSHFGFARELAAQFSRELLYSPLITNLPEEEFNEEGYPVIVNENAISYYALPIYRVQVGHSKMKFRSRLILCGMKSISSVVDVSNYLLLECGQPTHFFDKNKLTNHNLSVEYSKNGESILLLDGSTQTLKDGILLIKNGNLPVAIAGVMGGADSQVTESTKDLILESAIFRREDIRKSIRETGIRSEAAIRYEKGLDSFTCIPVIHRAIQLLRENGNNNLKLGKIQGYDHEKNKKTIINVSLEFIQKKLGLEISSEEPKTILQRLGFQILSHKSLDTNNIEWEVLVPRYRQNYDITIPEDIVEEIGRTIGYHKIPIKSLEFPVETPIPNSMRELERKWRQYLTNGLGFFEVYNYSFQSPEDARFEEEFKDGDIVSIQNEMPIHQSVMRTSIYPSLLKNAELNQDRFDKFGIYEIGRTYLAKERDPDGLPIEFRKLGILYMGLGRTPSEKREELEEDFLKIRIQIEKILYRFGFRTWEWDKTSKKYFHPQAGLKLFLNSEEVGELGILHNREADKRNLRKRPILFQLNLQKFLAVYETIKDTSPFKNPSPYPQSFLDISILLDQSHSTKDYADLVKKSNIPELDDVFVHDIFQGGNLPIGKKSVTYRILLIPDYKTFSHERIREITEELVNLAKEHNFTLR